MLSISLGRKMRLHVASQYGIDSRLITFLLTKPFEKIGIQADRYGFLRPRHDHARAFPETSIGRLDLRIGVDGPPDLAVSESRTRFQSLPALADAVPVRFSFMSLCPPG